MQKVRFSIGDVAYTPAWELDEITRGVAGLLESFADRLPKSPHARIVIKPNLNNDLVALTGNSVDLRVLGALISALQARGFTNIVVGDGSNIGIERRGIDAFARLRVDRLTKRYGVGLVDLNHDAGEPVVLCAGARPRVAETIMTADMLISVPKVKTHAEAMLSCAMKNWVGIACGQEKRHMHYDLARNIFAINEVVQPDLILVDAVIGMEGNGPGDGDPFRLGHLIMSDNAFLNDVAVAHMVGLSCGEVPYLEHAYNAGYFDDELIADVANQLPRVHTIRKPDPRTLGARLAEARSLMWLKKAVRPITDRPAMAEIAYKMGLIQDVYFDQGDEVAGVKRKHTECGSCDRCAQFCPTGLDVSEVGVKTSEADCVGCMYCWWVCPENAIELEGSTGHLDRQIKRYKSAIEKL